MNKKQKVSLIIFIISLATLVALWYIFPEKIYNWYKDFLLFKSFKVLFFIAFFSLTIFLILSYFHHQRVSEFLKKIIPFSKDDLKKLKPEIGAMEMTVSGVALYDVLYHLSKVDPLFLSAFNRIHDSTQNFENFNDLSEYLKKLQWREHYYKAYVGEEHTFDNLRNSSDNLFVPETTNNENFDFILNGQKYDRATSNDNSYIQQKLNDKPDDVHIWVGPDVDGKFANHPRVHISEDSMSSDELLNITNESYQGVLNLGDFLDGIPLITLAFSSAKNYKLVKSGSKDVESAVEHIVLDTLGVGVGSYLGGTLGLRLGQGLAPATGGASLIIIPAITTLLGSIIGIITGKGIVRTFKERNLRRSLRVLTEESLTFSNQYQKHYKPLLLTVKSKYRQNDDKLDEAISNNQNWFMKIFFPNVITKFSSKSKANYWKEFYEIKNHLSVLLIRVKKRKKKEKQEAGLILYEQGKDILFGYKPLVECWEKVDEALKNFKIEKGKLSLI